ncbi:putative colanic acid biosynthesis UDP-glucose lipid carrier transferase [Novimethylophilus kurashikiensis]|uniref:Putative colanic acid biosynthesis UDP-glucose lipid carrier transferase n=1 Tax=Novimethylophilus kurashikiensis TaxID=1825523 RepID=A0A2R5F9U8_9PROT|nr:undecaprenyl-phosphate glucose phosphotransferase [Novimethylophilus kurashikiensis]GBG15012.1 putative colanic acid biosynthesis UDP-glucose lipid carrier transferase [Novimethylophilus kurashikiensis]
MAHTTMASHTVPIRFRRAAGPALGWNNVLMLAVALLDPLALALSLWVIAWWVEGQLTPEYLVLSLLVFSLTLPGKMRLNMSAWKAIQNIVFGWAVMAMLLLFFGHATGYLSVFEPRAIRMWLWAAPLSQIGVYILLRKLAPTLALMGEPPRAIIAGVSEHGLALAKEIHQNPYNPTQLTGFFDDREQERIGDHADFPLLGSIGDIPKYVRRFGIEIIYISLPMATQPRIMKLLDELSDTTASIYFVPDIFVTDLMQGRMDSVGDLPVIAVCETPFTGTNGIVKRASDIVLSILILILISPIMIAIALGIWLTSPGPIIFRQRRYGLNGEMILVNKFRTMTVCEDGDTIQQAQKNDQRLTPIGAFLRKTSLDELPQFFNVLQGTMSIVGPRPHAVAHNELYRTMIKGYMLRHKVKPGITGWAQVNGWRGETDTLEKMKVRIEYDLAYLRNWSLRLDLYIILRTLTVVLRDRNAY